MPNLSVEHSFNVAVAEEVGVNAAIIMKSIHFWVDHNRANEKELHDGRYWTYESMRAFGEQFPYLTMRKVNTALKILEDRGFIMTGNYNSTAYDRTKWYSVTDEYLDFIGGKSSAEPVYNKQEEMYDSIPTKCKMENMEMSNQTSGNVEPIPDTVKILSDEDFDLDYDRDQTRTHTEKRIPFNGDQGMVDMVYFIHQCLWDKAPMSERRKICQTDDRRFSQPLIEKLLAEGMDEKDFRDAVDGVGITKRPSFWLKDSYDDILRFRSAECQAGVE